MCVLEESTIFKKSKENETLVSGEQVSKKCIVLDDEDFDALWEELEGLMVSPHISLLACLLALSPPPSPPFVDLDSNLYITNLSRCLFNMCFFVEVLPWLKLYCNKLFLDLVVFCAFFDGSSNDGLLWHIMHLITYTTCTQTKQSSNLEEGKKNQIELDWWNDTPKALVFGKRCTLNSTCH